MKRFLKEIVFVIVFLALIILFSNTQVFADMGAPMIEPYEATVSNVNGATYYKYGQDGIEKAGKFDYGYKVKIMYEQEIEDNEVYGSYYSEDYSVNYLIKLSDLEIVEEGKDFTKDFDLSNSKEIEIIAKNGVEIYKGPAYGYSKTGVTIPKGEILKGYVNKKDGLENPWLYVEYKNTKGFICSLEGTVGFEKQGKSLLTFKKINIYDNYETYKNSGIIGSIPANTIIKDYKDVDMWSRDFYVTYKGVSGYVNYYDIATETTSYDWDYTVNYPEAKMYSEGSRDSKVLVENIPVDTKLDILFSNDIKAYGWIYTTYNGVSGWVLFCDTPESYQFFLDNENNEEELDDEDEDIEDFDVDDEFVEDEDFDEDDEYYDDEIDYEDITMLPNFKLQIVLLCILVAVISSLTSFVTIVLVNYKKDKKNKNEKE